MKATINYYFPYEIDDNGTALNGTLVGYNTTIHDARTIKPGIKLKFGLRKPLHNRLSLLKSEAEPPAWLGCLGSTMKL